MHALVTVPGNTAFIEDIPKPTPSPSQLLVAVKCIAINPVDVLYVFEPSSPPGRTVGSDFCGTVEAWGKEVAGFNGGERVAGFVHGACTENTLPGAFAEYVVVDAELVFRVPEGVSSEEAATIPLCFMTAAQALHLRLGLPVPDHNTAPLNKMIAINGASSSVGQYAVQLAHLAGCSVLATASAANFDFIRSLGADVTIDYRSQSYSELLATSAGSSLALGLDCIAEGMTAKALTDTFSPTGGRCVVLRSTAWQVPHLRSDIEFIYTAVWSMLGVAFTYNHGTVFAPSRTDYAHAKAMYVALPGLLAAGRVRPNRVRSMQGGLAAILEGIQWLGGGNVSTRSAEGRKPLSAEKMVYML